MIHEPQASKEQRCVCDPESWGHDPDEICAGFVAGSMKAAWCETCGHDEECHLPRPPAASEPMVSISLSAAAQLIAVANSAPYMTPQRNAAVYELEAAIASTHSQSDKAKG
jgi:hypothetical protein